MENVFKANGNDFLFKKNLKGKANIDKYVQWFNVKFS